MLMTEESKKCFQCRAAADPQIGGKLGSKIEDGAYYGFDYWFAGYPHYICQTHYDARQIERPESFELIRKVDTSS